MSDLCSPRLIDGTEEGEGASRVGAVGVETGFTIRHVLLVEDRAEDIDLVASTLREVRGMAVDLLVEPDLPNAMACLAQRKVDLVLLDLSLPDAFGLEAINRFRTEVADIPFIALSPEEGIAETEAILHGAQDCLVKSHLNAQVLGRAIRYAIERHAMLEELRSLSLRDEMTGLHNRRGFLVLGEQQFRLSRRTGRPMILLFADVDGLKAANDAFGHAVGDDLLVDAANALADGVRDTDIVARLGGDEFAVLVLDAADDEAERVLGRIQHQIDVRNAREPGAPRLAISLGLYRVPTSGRVSLADVVERADREMYAEKKEKRRAAKLLTSRAG